MKYKIFEFLFTKTLNIDKNEQNFIIHLMKLNTIYNNVSIPEIPKIILDNKMHKIKKILFSHKRGLMNINV